MEGISNQLPSSLSKPFQPFGLLCFSFATITYGALEYFSEYLDGIGEQLKYPREGRLLQCTGMVLGLLYWLAEELAHIS